MRPRNALHLYRVRLRARLWQECFAIVGIAAGVALLFASQVSSSSLQSSVAQLSRGIAGNATLQLLARDPHGFPAEHAGARARHPRRARRRAGARSRRAGERPAGQRVGAADRRRREPVRARRRARAPHRRCGRSGGSARSCCPLRWRTTIGVTQFGQEVTLQLAGHTTEAPLYAQLHAQPDRRADRQPGRARAAVLRAGTDRSGRAREPHPRAARRRLASAGAGRA